MRTNNFARLTVFCMIALVASGRTLKQFQPPPPVTGEELERAIAEINNFSQVPDTSTAVASSPAYYSMVANLQGPAAAIVQAANLLSVPVQAPTVDTYYDYVNGLRAYGYQSGKDALGPAGQALYSAYEAITNFLGFGTS